MTVADVEATGFGIIAALLAGPRFDDGAALPAAAARAGMPKSSAIAWRYSAEPTQDVL